MSLPLTGLWQRNQKILQTTKECSYIYKNSNINNSVFLLEVYL